MRNEATLSTWLQLQLLNRIAPPERYAKGPAPTTHHSGLTKIRRLLGDGFLDEIQNKTILDFGCGEGLEAVALAEAGAKWVIGVESRQNFRERATKLALTRGVADRCKFVKDSSERADIVLSIDAFEHFDDPASVLRSMHRCLAPGGEVVAAFGYVWLHPLGGHLFSVFPWAHLILSENALVEWRSQFATDRARSFSEVEGGLNKMTIARFEQLVSESPLYFSDFELVPIRALRFFHNRFTREFLTSFVRCRLRAASAPHEAERDEPSEPPARATATPEDRIRLSAVYRSDPHGLR